MGTRNLTAVVLDGEYRVAQYGQWDGYPSGQGKRVLNFIKLMRKKKEDQFKAHLRLCSYLSKDEFLETWKSFNMSEHGTVANRHSQKYPELSRDTGAGILELVLNASSGLKLKNEIEFAGDSLFCEYAYVINMDNRTLECYRGFNTEPLPVSERFACYNHVALDGHEFRDKTKEPHKYYPVKLVKTYKFNRLPSLVTLEKEYFQFDKIYLGYECENNASSPTTTAQLNDKEKQIN